MQSFLRKSVINYPNLSPSHNYHRVFHTQKAFSFLPKPSQPQIPDHICGSRFTHSFHHPHSWSSKHTLPCKIRRFLSDPALSYQFMFNSSSTVLRISGRKPLDCRLRLLRAQFHGQGFNFNRMFYSYQRVWRSRFLTPSGTVFGLIIANVAVFLSWRIADTNFMSNNFTISLDNVKGGRLHTLITNAFSHIETHHIVSNMIGLYFFGMNIANTFGCEYLLKLYLVGAVGGSVFYLLHQAYKAHTSKGRSMFSAKEQALGASGAVSAIMLLEIFLFPKATLYFDFIIPVPAILLGIFLIGKDMLRVIEIAIPPSPLLPFSLIPSIIQVMGDTHISGASHLGGAAVAAIAWARVRKGRF